LRINHHYYEEVTNLLPGVVYMQKGYNPLAGRPIYEGGQADVEMFEFTYDQGRTTSGDVGYLVPDQMNIPVLSFMCETSGMTSEITTTNSLESMVAAAKSNSLSRDASASVSGSYGAISMSASFEMAMSESNSSSSDTDQKQSESNNT
jgi:hypothetical protein